MNEKWKDYYYKGLAVFLTVAMCILFFFAVFRLEELGHYVKMVVNILMPFIYGAVIAYLLTPVCKVIQTYLEDKTQLQRRPPEKAKKLKSLFKGISILLSILLFCLIIYALIAMLVPQLVNSVLLLVDAMPGYIQTASIWLEKLVEDNPVMLSYVEQYSTDIMDYVQNFAKTSLLPNINNIITGVSASLLTMIGVAKNLIIGLIVAVYFLNSRELFCCQARLMTHAIFRDREMTEEEKASGKEQKAEWIIRETNVLNEYLGGFVKGKLLDSLIIGLICMIFTAVVKMPYAVLVSVIIGVTNIIPFFGPFIGAIPTALLILMVSPIQCVYFVVFIIVLQQFDGNILGPKILGNTTQLSSFWVLFAILLFGGVFGIVGMIVGVPIFGFVYHLIRDWMHDRLGIRKVTKE
ncbi:AI-2E family transporter [Clostridiaceae bacterium Marseille-Q4145]|nr:AI-2E family transporter [Clostridiaceae bacterium Marseille-Q4145]